MNGLQPFLEFPPCDGLRGHGTVPSLPRRQGGVIAESIPVRPFRGRSVAVTWIAIAPVSYCTGVLSGISGPSCLGGAPFIHAGGSMWFVERSFSLQTNSIISWSTSRRWLTRTVNGRV